MPLRLLTALLLTGVLLSNVWAQRTDVAFERIKVPGIANKVGSVVQDREGFIWFTVTGGGLVRYDGYEFKKYSLFAKEAGPKGYDGISDLYVNSKGALWISSRRGLYRFDPRTEELTSFHHDANDGNSLSSDKVWTTLEDREGILWVGTEAGLDRFDPSTGIFTHYRHDPNDPLSLSSGWPWRLFEDKSGTLWVATGLTVAPFGGGLSRFDSKTNTFTRFEADPDDESALIDPMVTTIDEDSRGHFWVGTGRGGLHTMDRERGTFRRYRYDPLHPTRLSPPQSEELPIGFPTVLRFIHEDQRGIIWIGAWGGGINLYAYDKDRVTHYNTNLDRLNGLSTDRIWTLAESRDGTVWIGGFADTGLEGLHRAIYTTPIGSWSYSPDSTRSIMNAVSSVHESKGGTLWVGTSRSGLIRIDRETGAVRHYQHDPRTVEGLADNHVGSIQETVDGLLWIGGNVGGLERFDPISETFERFQNDVSDSLSLARKSIRALHLDANGRLWIGTNLYGLARFDPKTGDLAYYTNDPQDEQSLSNRSVDVIHESSDGSLWVGTWDGLNRFDPVHETFERFLDGQPDRGPISAIAEREDGQLWVGWLGGSLARLDPKSGSAEHVDTRKAGLPGGEIGAMLVDDSGNLWVRSKGAITRFDEEDNRFYSYPPGGDEAFAGSGYAAFKSSNGELFFGGPHTVHAFYPEEVLATENRVAPQVAITGFNLLGEKVEVGEHSPLKQTIPSTDEIRLNHDQNGFSFSFAALHYLSPENNRHLFMLEGYDDDWREAGPDRLAAYYKVPPGSYRFRVKAANPFGVWSEEEAAIGVVILPPWWQSWWAYTLYVIMVALMATGWHQARIQSLKKQATRLNEMVKQRTKDLRDAKEKTEEQAKRLIELDQVKDRFFFNISHEFRTPLTLILGPLQDALSGLHGDLPPPLRRSLHTMQRNGRRLHRLISQLLDLSKLEVGRMALQARESDVATFVKFIVLSFAPLAERKKIALKFRAETEQLPIYFDADKLEHVITNLLSNAFKFTSEHGKILVTISEGIVDGKTYAQISIKDTGIGIAAAELPFIFDRFHQADASRTRSGEGTGIGLALAEEMVHLHRGEIDVESEEGFGTEFIIRLPTGKDHLAPNELADDVDSDGTTRPVGGYSEPSWMAEIQTPETMSTEDGAEVVEGRPTILIVDDNEDVREYLKSHLTGLYRIQEASDGLDGLQKAAEGRPDLILTDVMMPGMDGYELCRTIKQDERLSHVPVVLLTARASEEAELEGLGAGADDYICKPFNAESLLARVENLIEIRRLLRKRFGSEVSISGTEITVESVDAEFLQGVRDVIEAHLGDTNFSVEWLAEEVGLSTRQLRRKLQGLVNLSPNGFIRMVRLERSAQLLEQRAGNVSEVAYRVGFNDPRYFSKLFQQTFGVSPSAYSKETSRGPT